MTALLKNCQRASRAKTRGWRGGSIIEPCEIEKKPRVIWRDVINVIFYEVMQKIFCLRIDRINRNALTL